MKSTKRDLPTGMPNPKCHWIIDRNDRLLWDGDESFDDCKEWLQYLIDRFFQPEGVTISGQVICYESDIQNGSFIIADNNVLTTVPFRLFKDGEHWILQ